MSTLEQAVHDFSRRGFNHAFGTPAIELKPDAEWQKVHEAGTALWLDTGDIEVATSLWNASFEALTTNNSLLNNEIQKGLYDNLVVEAAAAVRDAQPELSNKALVLEVAFILNAHHGLRLVEQFDAKVSVELHTDLANDVERSVAYGRRYYAICPERFIIKVPLTPAGYLSARQLAAEGIPINFTLGFSARQNYVAALITQPSWVNVFMGRLNAVFSNNDLGPGDNVGEKTTLATQRVLIELRETGRSQTKLIGASIRSGDQVGELAGLDVMTIPTKAAAQYREAPLEKVVSGVGKDPGISLAEGVTLESFHGEVLWEVPSAFRACVEGLAGSVTDTTTPEEVQSHFAKAGFPGFLPVWSEQDVARVAEDGKIPVYANWKERLTSGEVSLDALMNLSALHAFIKDQAALDERIRQQLEKAGAKV